MSLLQRLSSLRSAAWRCLDQPRLSQLATWAVPVGFGVLSLLLGQDANWDLQNYHRYNPFALLNGKVGFDLAPAQWQSYFNPTLDLLYYGLTAALPAPLAGFLMGLLHGLNFVLLAAIARRLLPAGDAAGRHRLPLLLALAGSCGAGFLTQLGNSMGDNMTSLFVLGALLCVLDSSDALGRRGPRGAVLAAGAGLAMGLGTGLKLTNATYALALCAALLALPGGLRLGLRNAFSFGGAVLAGIAVSAGHWYWRLWQLFGNPLFPQFNDLFHGPLAAPIGIGDTGWLPRSLTEKLLWPFIFALDSRRVGELTLTLLVWPLLYVAFALLAVKTVAGAAPDPRDTAPARRHLLLAFFGLAYLGWLNLFGIYRYLIPLELLAPLVLWLLVQRLLRPSPLAARVGAAAVLATSIAALPAASWGHARWSREAFAAEVPAFAQPQQSMVFTVHGDPPMGWLVPQFPVDLAFVALGSGFPESRAYQDRVAAMAAARRGPLYVMLQADRHAPGAPRSEQANRGALERARAVLRRYGYALDDASCQAYPAFVGRSRWPYQLCRVAARHG